MSDDKNAAGAPAGDAAADDEVLAELRRMTVLLDPVPPEAVAAARSAIAWRAMDAELAELTGDTSVDPHLAGVRRVVPPTILTFDAPDLSVEVEVLEETGGRRLLGQLVPPAPGDVEVRHAGGRLAVTADAMGRFSAPAIATGPISLRCEVGGRVVDTDWFLA